MKTKRKPTRTRSSSEISVDTVLNCDDILGEILLRLPATTALRLRTVCKRWHRIISSRVFQDTYLYRRNKSYRPLSGFFYVSSRKNHSKSDILDVPNQTLQFIPTTIHDSQPLISCSSTREASAFAVSPQGFVLYGLWPSSYYICNPQRNQCIQLPKPKVNNDLSVVGFCCDDLDIIVHLRVVRFFDEINGAIPIEEFCSRTWEWKERKLLSPTNFELVPHSRCDVFDGVFYFQAKVPQRGYYLVAFDSKIEENSIRLIRPPGRVCNMALGQSSSGRLELALARHGCVFKFYYLKKNLSQYDFLTVISEDEWYNWLWLDLTNFISRSRSLAPTNDDIIPVPSGGDSENPLVLAFHPLHSRLVYFRSGERIFFYNLDTFQAMFVKHQGKALPSSDYDLFPYVQPRSPTSLAFENCCYKKSSEGQA